MLDGLLPGSIADEVRRVRELCAFLLHLQVVDFRRAAIARNARLSDDIERTHERPLQLLHLGYVACGRGCSRGDTQDAVLIDGQIIQREGRRDETAIVPVGRPASAAEGKT